VLSECTQVATKLLALYQLWSRVAFRLPRGETWTGEALAAQYFSNGVRKRFTTRAERRGRMPAYIRKARLRCAHEDRVGRSLREAPTKWQTLPRQGNALLTGSGQPRKVGPGEPKEFGDCGLHNRARWRRRLGKVLSSSDPVSLGALGC
jgi:hypothetical protein